MEATLQRKLTTIVVADVVGSSRLMGLDEEGTHARLAALGQELISPAIEDHGGTLVKKTGDGFLAEFPSVVEAIRCATEIHKGVERRNLELPSELWILFRIGINTGDVIVADDDIHLLAHVFEAHGQPVAHMVPDHAGDHDGARLRQLFKPRRDVHALAASRTSPGRCGPSESPAAVLRGA